MAGVAARRVESSNRRRRARRATRRDDDDARASETRTPFQIERERARDARANRAARGRAFDLSAPTGIRLSFVVVICVAMGEVTRQRDVEARRRARVRGGRARAAKRSEANEMNARFRHGGATRADDAPSAAGRTARACAAEEASCAGSCAASCAVARGWCASRRASRVVSVERRPANETSRGR